MSDVLKPEMRDMVRKFIKRMDELFPKRTTVADYKAAAEAEWKRICDEADAKAGGQ